MNRLLWTDTALCAKLEERGLQCSLLLPGKTARDFPSQLCDEVEDLLMASFGREVTPEHFATEMWAVVIHPATGPPVSFCSLTFYTDLPSFFTTRFEAVHPTVQKTGLGRLLYECVAVWTRFLVFNDPYVMDGILQSSGTYCLVSVIDAPDQPDWELTSDNEDGHGTFLMKLGFIRAQHDFHQTEDEIAFQREFHVPVDPELEAALGLPPRPATA
jgi:hypothetical protein